VRILVTGGAGFVGSNLCRKLSEGNEVFVFDNLSTGNVKNLREVKADFIWADVKHPFECFMDVDQIYHLACPASPVHYQADPINTIKTSFLGSLNALEYAKICKARVLLTSTSEIYGDPLEHPQKETYWGHVNSIGIRSCYDEGKRAAESLFMDYHRKGADTRIARIFNTYGPNMSPDDGRVVSNFIVAALKNKPITIYGDGTQTRSFMYIDDLVNGLIKLMNSDYTSPVNLGNPVETQIGVIAKVIKDLTGSSSEIIMLPIPQDDPKRRKPDITLAKSLGWMPSVSLIDGLKKTIEYFRWLL
jgi:UDP-glucuronate decarboxylase